MFKRYVALSAFINQALKLNGLPRATCIRKYTLTYDEEEREKKRKSRPILVNVIMPDQKVNSMTIENAEKMAKRRDFTLSKLMDPPKFASFAGREVYEMYTKSQHVKQLSEPAEGDPEIKVKEKKTISVSASIAPHDLSVKLKHIKKWLSKNHIVVVIVSSGGKAEAMTEQSTYIQTECKEECQITVVNKKKQTVLTLVPKINKSQDEENPHGKDKPQENDKLQAKVKPEGLGLKATTQDVT